MKLQMISAPDGETKWVPGAAAHDLTATRIWEKAGTKKTVNRESSQMAWDKEHGNQKA